MYWNTYRVFCNKYIIYYTAIRLYLPEAEYSLNEGFLPQKLVLCKSVVIYSLKQMDVNERTFNKLPINTENRITSNIRN